MNCKQGDLAMIVRVKNPTPKAQQQLGKIVRCVELVEKQGLVGWRFEPELPPFTWTLDSNLKPIRPDGLRGEKDRRTNAPA